MEPIVRTSEKVLLTNEDDRVLLCAAEDLTRLNHAPFWFAIGGGLNDGEPPAEAAIREVKEETGLQIDDVGPVVMSRHTSFVFEGVLVEQDEHYFFKRIASFDATTDGMDEIERRTHAGFRWWSVEDLRDTKEPVFPEGLADLLENLLRSQ